MGDYVTAGNSPLFFWWQRCGVVWEGDV